MVEIGPGLGALTRPLLARLKHLHVVEIDRDLVARLKQEFPPERLTIHEGDALQFDFAALGTGLRVVGNLPYNISTPLLFHLAQSARQIRDIHVMLQKEVVERMVAQPPASELRPAVGHAAIPFSAGESARCAGGRVPPRAQGRFGGGAPDAAATLPYAAATRRCWRNLWLPLSPSAAKRCATR